MKPRATASLRMIYLPRTRLERRAPRSSSIARAIPPWIHRENTPVAACTSVPAKVMEVHWKVEQVDQGGHMDDAAADVQ